MRITCCSWRYLWPWSCLVLSRGHHHPMSGTRGLLRWHQTTAERGNVTHICEHRGRCLTSQRKLNGEKERIKYKESLEWIKLTPPSCSLWDDIWALLAEEITRELSWVMTMSLGHLSPHLSSQIPSCIFLLNMSLTDNWQNGKYGDAAAL